MERDGFVFYRSFYDAIKDLDAESFKRIVAWICEYWLNSTLPEGLFWIENTVFTLIRPQMDANNKRYKNWCKGWQFWHLWWAPSGNQNAVKNWDNIWKQPQWGWTNNPKTTPKDKDKDKDKDKEKGYGGKQDANVTLDAEASRWNTKDAVGEKNKSMTLNEKLKDLWLEDEVIELAIVYNGCKKWKKLDKFKDAQLKIRVSKLRKCWFDSIEGMKQVLENSIAGWYEWIFELKTKPIPSSIPIQGWVVKVGNSNIFL